MHVYSTSIRWALLLLPACAGCGSDEAPTISSSPQEKFIDFLDGTLKPKAWVTSFDDDDWLAQCQAAIDTNDHEFIATNSNSKVDLLIFPEPDIWITAVSADHYPYVRIKINSGKHKEYMGYVHKDFLELEDDGLDLRNFTSDRGTGRDWRTK